MEGEEMTDQEKIKLLATEVMGWHTSEFNGSERWYKECGNSAERINWNPLQNIADAWQIYMELIEKHEDATLTFPWYVVADWHSEEGWRIRGEGDTAQEAICNAAINMLEVVGHEKTQASNTAAEGRNDISRA